MGFAFGEEGVGAFLHVHCGEAFAECSLFAGKAVQHAGAGDLGAGQAGGQRAAVVVGSRFATEGIGFPGCIGVIGGVGTATAGGVAMMGLVGAMGKGTVGAVGVVVVATAVGEAVAGGDV